jgi:hypothetical protein
MCYEFYDIKARYRISFTSTMARNNRGNTMLKATGLSGWLRKEIKSIVREAMDEWVKDVEYLTQPTNKDGRYYCSKSDCEGVRFPTPNEVSESTPK